MIAPLGRRLGGKFTPVNMKIVIVVMLGNIERSRMMKGTSPWTYKLYFGSLNKMKITYSEPKYYLGRPGKGLIASLCLNNIKRSKKKKRSRYSITNDSLKDIFKYY